MKNYDDVFNYYIMKQNQTVLTWSMIFPEDYPRNMNNLMNLHFSDEGGV